MDAPAQLLDVAGRIRGDSMELDDYIYHVGDTNTRFGFNSTDQIRFETSGLERLQIVGDDIRFNYYGRIEVYAGVTAETTFDNGIFIRDINNGSGIIMAYAGYEGTDRTSVLIYDYCIGKNVSGGNAILSIQLENSTTSNTNDFVAGIEAYATSGATVRVTFKSYGTRSGGNVTWRVAFMRLNYA